MEVGSAVVDFYHAGESVSRSFRNMQTQTYQVSQWRGTEGGYVHLGFGLTEEAALARIVLCQRVWPERARPKAYAEKLGETHTREVIRKLQ